MEKKKYYAITTSMKFEKTVLVPVDSVKDLGEAMDLVDCYVETASIMLLNEEAICETRPSDYADANGIEELADDEIDFCDVIRGDCEDLKALDIVLNAVDKALRKYSSDNVDVVYNMETGMFDVMYCCNNNSFLIEATNVLFDDIVFSELFDELIERNVGYVGR